MGLGQGQADDEGIRQDRAGQQHLPGQGDRHHEQRGQGQVGGKHPLGQAQVLGLDVLHHGDVELPRQADDRHHGDAGLHHHRRPVDGFLPILLQARGEHGLAEQVVETVVQAIGDKGADREKGQQLDQGFEGNRQHHTAVVLGGVEVAGTEDDGEQRQDQRHDQRRVLGAGAHGVGAGADQQVHAKHDALELQGDVGQHTDQADQRHHHRQRLGFAIARGDEVGDGGDVFLLADHHHLLQDPGCQHQQQDRPEVDRQERPELLGGLADGAEEGPAGAVHRQRQAVHPGTHPRRQGRAATVTVKGDGEHDGHIGQGDDGDQPAGQRHENSEHKGAPGASARSDSLARCSGFVSVDQGIGAARCRRGKCEQSRFCKG